MTIPVAYLQTPSQVPKINIAVAVLA